MVTQEMVSPARFKAGMRASRHKFASLAAALQVTDRTLRDFASGKRQKMYSVDMDDLKRELLLDKIA
jgi:hypothetical protein